MILQDPHETLHTKCKPVNFKEAKKLATLLKQEYDQVVKDAKSMIVVGLAAPQIGLPKRMFIALGEVFINPSIHSVSTGIQVMSDEGCLSLPDTYRRPRYSSITVSWLDEARKLRHQVFSYREAIIFQHEYDHLEGKLCNEY